MLSLPCFVFAYSVYSLYYKWTKDRLTSQFGKGGTVFLGKKSFPQNQSFTNQYLQQMAGIKHVKPFSSCKKEKKNKSDGMLTLIFINHAIIHFILIYRNKWSER